MVNKDPELKKDNYLQMSSVAILRDADLPWEMVKKQLDNLDVQFSSVYDRLQRFEKISQILHIEELEGFSREASEAKPLLNSVKKVALELICKQKDKDTLEQVVNQMVDIVGHVYQDLHSLADSAIQPESHLQKMKNVKHRLEEFESSTFKSTEELLSSKRE